MARVLVISPHPDDEALGCGGTLRRHTVGGDDVHAIFLTSGEKGGHGRAAEETIELREREALDAAKILGIRSTEFWRQSDGALAASEPLVARLVQTVLRLRPRVLYAPHPQESHSDHRAAAVIVTRAMAALEGALRPDVLMYEIWTPLRVMNHIEDITEFIDTKVQAIRAHKCQNDVLGFDEAFRGLARYRGEMFCWPEGDYAEVFQRLGNEELPPLERAPHGTAH